MKNFDLIILTIISYLRNFPFMSPIFATTFFPEQMPHLSLWSSITSHSSVWISSSSTQFLIRDPNCSEILLISPCEGSPILFDDALPLCQANLLNAHPLDSDPIQQNTFPAVTSPPAWALTPNAEPPLCINASVAPLGLWISKLDYPPAWTPSSDSVSIYQAIGWWEPLL